MRWQPSSWSNLSGNGYLDLKSDDLVVRRREVNRRGINRGKQRVNKTFAPPGGKMESIIKRRRQQRATTRSLFPRGAYFREIIMCGGLLRRVDPVASKTEGSQTAEATPGGVGGERGRVFSLPGERTRLQSPLELLHWLLPRARPIPCCTHSPRSFIPSSFPPHNIRFPGYSPSRSSLNTCETMPSRGSSPALPTAGRAPPAVAAAPRES